jgi:predicted MFS family arabinose efflux permease
MMQKIETQLIYPITFIVIAIAMTSVTYGFGRYAYGLFLPSLRAEFSASTAQLGLIASANAATYLVSTVLASAYAIYFRPTSMMVLACAVAIAGLLTAGLATSIEGVVFGIVLAGVGGGILSPALFEALEAWLPEEWKVKAIGAVSAGATPGMVITALAAYGAADAWRLAWIIMGLVGLSVAVVSFVMLPNVALHRDAKGPKVPLEVSLFIQSRNYILYFTLLIYGLVFSVYLTFAVDLLNSVGQLSNLQGQLFWAALGAAGLPAVASGFVITAIGLPLFLRLTFLLCATAYALVALAPSSLFVVLLSSLLFGYTSIAIGSGLLVWSLRIFKDRPSIGSGVVFFLFSATAIVGPVVGGLLIDWVGSTGLFGALAGLSVIVAIILTERRLT